MDSDDVKKTASGAVDHAKQSAAQAKSSASDYASQAGDQASAAADKASAAASDLYDRAQKKVKDVADGMPSASEAMDHGQRAYEQGSSQVVEQVKKQPLEALLLATALGYLIGWALNR